MMHQARIFGNYSKITTFIWRVITISSWFPCAYTCWLKLAAQTKSLTHYTKGTPSLHKEALTACRHSVSDTISFPLSGCFSPFPHGTSSLSVIKEYLGLGSGLPIFRQNFTCSALLENKNTFYLYGTITHFGLTFQKVLVIIFLLLAWSAFARHY